MGCTGSKGGGEDGEGGFSFKDIMSSPNKSENIRDGLKKAIGDVVRQMETTKEKMRLLEHEKAGLVATNIEMRDKLQITVAKTDKLREDREEQMNEIWSADAKAIHSACTNFNGADKEALVDVMTNRTNWQITRIADEYQKMYKTKMMANLETSFKSMLGLKTGLCRFILLRCMEPSTCLATLLREYSDGLTLDDDHLIELIMTRTNAELKAAFKEYKSLYKKDFVEIVGQKISLVQSNYKAFMMQVLELRRDEDNKPFDDGLAKEYAAELYAAGGARLIGCEQEYTGNNLLRDVQKKLGGSFGEAVSARCQDRYKYLASRLFIEKDAIPRIFGSMTHAQCRLIAEAYDEMFPRQSLRDRLEYEFGTSAQITRNLPYLHACLNMISTDQSVNPAGSSNSQEEDEQQGREEGEKAMHAAEEKYQRMLMVTKGEAIVKEQGSIVDEIKTPADLGDLFLAINSNSKLFQTLKEYDTLLSDIKRQEVDLADEIQANKDTYLELIRMNAESTELSRIYQSTIRSLTDYQSR